MRLATSESNCSDRLSSSVAESRPLNGSGPIATLIVDSHIMVAEGLAVALSSTPDIVVMGIEHSIAGAHKASITMRPDVILLEEHLTDGSGSAFLALLPRGVRARVLIVTADASDSVLARAIVAGAAGVVPKSKPMNTLASAVRATFRDEPVIAPTTLRRLLPRLGQGRGSSGILSSRELQVLELLIAGQGTAALAAELHISPATARNHIQSIMRKLGAHSRLEAVSIALKKNHVDFSRHANTGGRLWP